MNNTSIFTLLLTCLNWFAALIGILILCAGFSFLPALFGVEQSSDVLMRASGVILSKGVIDAFPFGWNIGVMIFGTFLYTWICSIFSMSTHLMIVSIVQKLTHGMEDGDRQAWLIVALLAFLFTLFFVYILYGSLFNMLALSLALLIMHIIGFILVLNYTDHDGQLEEMKYFA